MTKKEAIHFLYQIADEIQSFLDKTSSPKGQWTSHKRLEALSMAISALYDLFQAEEDGRLIIPPCKVGDTVWVITGTAIKLCTVDRIHILGNGQVQIRAKYFVTDNIYLYPDMFGKTVFLTCAEAEAAIEARKEGKEYPTVGWGRNDALKPRVHSVQSGYHYGNLSPPYPTEAGERMCKV